MARSYHQQKYTPAHPEKYIGDPTDIFMRSSWETKFAQWCDHNPSVIQWSSETTIIPYKCPTDDRWHRYFVDFKIRIRDSSGNTSTYLVEIKPFSQTHPPKQSEKKTKRYITEVMTWGKNDAKWKAAREYCKDHGYQFIILTEHELGLKAVPRNRT